MFSTGDYAAGKVMVDAAITTATVDPSGVVTMNFTVNDAAGHPYTTVTQVSGVIAKLVPPAAGSNEPNHWVDYIQRRSVPAAGAAGSCQIQATSEKSPNVGVAPVAANGVLTNNGNGTYTYRFATNVTTIAALACPAGDNGPVGFEPTLTHRVVLMMGGHTGPTANAEFDFRPDGQPITERRDIIDTNACRECHGDEFHGHGGNRLNVATCDVCHNPGTTDVSTGNTVDMKVFIHKLHAGEDLPSNAGPDGIYWDDPATVANEAADNTPYKIGNADFSDIGFPALIENCTKCHSGTGAQVDNWKTRPSRAACGSCHSTVDFALGTNHAGGPQADDNACKFCHSAAGTPASVSNAHDWAVKDPRNISEFNIDLSITDAAGNANHVFAAGETPVVHIVVKNGNTPIDHTTILQEVAPAEGCLVGGCPPGDGTFSAGLFVNGPRTNRVPVLSSKARAKVVSGVAGGVGPFNLGAAVAADTLSFHVDGNKAVRVFDAWGRDSLAAGTFTVAYSAAAFANPAAATAAEVVAWLNNNAAFKLRAIAYLDEATGKLAVRSRNRGQTFSMQLDAGTLNTALFNVSTVATIGGSTVSNSFAKQLVAANNDPKVRWLPGEVTYTLDPVDDLQAGTYIANIEFSDRGRVDGVNYRTPSVAVATFQVGTATVELPPANNCDLCHQNADGKGMIFDQPRHHKIFGQDAVDQCGACHDYQPQNATGAFSGAIPISRRVHAVHMGSGLNYPQATVGHADEPVGRNWQINFPQDIRNCETCHEDGTSSGTWATEPARIPCSGCHDSDAATAHMNIQTFDPTPADPYSGDEQESCKACH